jgi:hypothetical protein
MDVQVSGTLQMGVQVSGMLFRWVFRFWTLFREATGPCNFDNQITDEGSLIFFLCNSSYTLALELLKAIS